MTLPSCITRSYLRWSLRPNIILLNFGLLSYIASSERLLYPKHFTNTYRARHLEEVLKFQSNLREVTHPPLFKTLPLHSLNHLFFLLLSFQTLPIPLPILAHLAINAQLYLLLSIVSCFWMLEDALISRIHLDHWLLEPLRMTVFHLMFLYYIYINFISKVKQDHAGYPRYVYSHNDLHLQCMSFRLRYMLGASVILYK